MEEAWTCDRRWVINIGWYREMVMETKVLGLDANRVKMVVLAFDNNRNDGKNRNDMGMIGMRPSPSVSQPLNNAACLPPCF